MANKIENLKHPYYVKNIRNWKLYRSVLDGGTAFIDQHLKRFSGREDENDFRMRKSVTYLPAFASEAVRDVTNSISSRMVDIERSIADKRVAAVVGSDVDGGGNNLTKFLINDVIESLLGIQRVGIMVDRHAEDRSSPYCYTINADDILNWQIDDAGFYTNLLIRKSIEKSDTDTGLVNIVEAGYSHYRIIEGVMHIQDYDAKGVEVGAVQEVSGHHVIPFVLVELKHSLLKDVARYQIALLNMASSDVYYILAANFPFYTEQFDRSMEIAARSVIVEAPDSGTDVGGVINDSKDMQNVEVGVTKGRRYGKDLDRPQFIAPPTDPLVASMRKQEEAKREIKQLLSQSIANMRDQSTSADSKKADMTAVESGLLSIAVVLETAERLVIKHINHYYNADDSADVVTYPRDYTLTTERQRRDEGADILRNLTGVPSMHARKVLSFKASKLMLGPTATAEDLQKVKAESMEMQVKMCVKIILILHPI